LTKNILRLVNFINLKTQGGYTAKSKPQRVCLQLSQTPGGDYTIWPKKKDYGVYRAINSTYYHINYTHHIFLNKIVFMNTGILEQYDNLKLKLKDQ
jgi:hypothetical protein